MSMNKRVTIPMETSAYYQPISNLNVQFWSQDRNTAELRFLVTRNNFPLSLSGENVQIVLALESGDSFIVENNLNIDNEVEGVATYIIPQEFMAVANEVTGQIYVATLDGDEVVVQRKFTFTVENDLLSSIPSEEKLRYIKMFSELQQVMSDRLGGLETALTQLEQNVADVNNARQAGITAINNLYNAKLVTFNQNYDDKMALINNSMSDIENYVDTSLADMTQKKADFDASVTGSGLVTTGQSKDWQKVKLTSDNGIRMYLTKGSVRDITALNAGFYETVAAGTTDAATFPQIAYGSFVELDVMKSDAGRMQVKLVINGNGRTFNRYIHTNGSDDTGWLEMPQFTDISTMETSQGSQSKANTAENNAKVYTDTKFNSRHKTLFEGTANGVGTTLSLSETLDNFLVLYVYGNFDGGNFVETGDPEGSSDIVIDRTNVIGTDGAYATVFECVIQKVNRTQLKITSDTYHGINPGNGSGPNANRFTINKIVGVRK